MKKEIAVSAIVAGLVLILVGTYSTMKEGVFSDDSTNKSDQTKIQRQEWDYVSLSEALSQKLDAISPTENLGRSGWIAQKISFVKDSPLAYVEYTDTHVALRILLSYTLVSDGVRTKVLATFVPNEYGTRWLLDFGEDKAEGKIIVSYVFDGDSNQWIPEIIN